MRQAVGNEKDITQQVVGAYLAQQAPEKVAELEVVFEAVYRKETRPQPIEPVNPDDPGQPFGPNIVTRSLINAAIWATIQLVRTAITSKNRAEAERRFDALEPRLAEGSGRLEMVRQIRVLLDTLFDGLEAELEPGQASRLPSPPPPSPTPVGPLGPAAKTHSHQPDLQILVREEVEEAAVRLAYSLNARRPELGLNFATFVSEPIRRDPQASFSALYRDIESLSFADEEDRHRARRRLAAWGLQLFDQLLPRELQRILWSLREEVESVHVLSEEPWIPWELLKLRNPDQRHETGPFFGETFAITRWTQGREQLVLDFPLRSIALVIPDDSRLPSAGAERRKVLGLRGSGRDVEEVAARYRTVTDVLSAGRHDGWHFISHGRLRGDDPDRWGLVLEDNTTFTPPELVDISLGAARPLVLLNACHSGRSALALTGIGGWARAFLNAGAGAVIGSHWALSDPMGVVFAETFYGRFLAGTSLGVALRDARLAARDAFPGDPSWLAYTAFAHPLATVA